LKASELVDNKVIWLLFKDNSLRFGRDNSISGILVNLLLYNRNSIKDSTEDEANDLISLAASVSSSWLSLRYSHVQKNWWRPFIRVSAKISRGKKLIGALEVSYTASKFIPLSAKQKAD
jgi:hypothetical protein